MSDINRYKRYADLQLANRLAAQGYVKSARALIARSADDRPVAAIEVTRQRPERPAAPAESVVMDRTQKIELRLVEMHDDMGDLSYDRQPVVTTEHKTTVRILLEKIPAEF